eukprot:6870996-Pyramimonas_sp.AAC.1
MSATDGQSCRSCSTRPAEGYENYRYMHLETVRHKLKEQRWACQALAVLGLMGMVENAGMQKNRLQLKKL